MKKIYKFWVLIIFVIHFSCEKDKNHLIRNDNFIFELSEKKYFQNNNNYFLSFTTQVGYSFDKSILYRKRMRSNYEGINIFSLDKDDAIHESIKLNDEHLRHLKKLRGFYVKNKDSIFLFGLTKLLIVNSVGEIIYKNHFNPPQEDNYFPITITNKVRPFIQGNNIFFTKIIDINPSNELYKSNVLIKYNYIDNTLTDVKNTSYPKLYYNKCWTTLDLEVNHTLNNMNEVVFSYPINDSLFIYSLESEEITKIIPVKSAYKRKNVEDVKCDKVWDTKEYHKHSYESFLYRDLVYNKHLDIYYRFMQLPTENYNLNKKFNSLNNRFIIMVLDNHLNVIHESKIFNQSPTYVPFDYFVTKKGLWISTNNPDNLGYDEGKLSFQLFELKSI